MEDFEVDWQHGSQLHYRLCPRCAHGVPANSEEHCCINEGPWMLEGCPLCSADITSPYAQFCATCGLEFKGLTTDAGQR